MRTFVLILLTVTLTNGFSQTVDYKKIEEAISNANIETLLEYAPDKSHGPTEFATPKTKKISLYKAELGEHIKNYLQSKSEFEYEQLFGDKVQYFPLIIGKFTNGNETEYLMIGMADFGGTYRYLSFEFLAELPDKMKSLDKK